MTDEEIKKLAEECSLYYQGRPAKRGYELSNRLTIEGYALMTLKWLSKNYCIVPKEQVRKFYKTVWGKSVHKIRLEMTDNFGKDMFEEEGK